MRTKLVIWGTNATDARVLITLELKPNENKVEVRTFPEPIAIEELFTKLKTEWSDTTAPFVFPEGGTILSRELTVNDSILPDDLKTDRTDLIQVKQTEWHFIVLSTKLHENYKTEIQEIEEKIGQITGHSAELWDSLKGFWSKVSDQVKEKNLFREHAEELKSTTNVLFDKLKEKRGELEKEFEASSSSVFTKLSETLDEVEKSVQEGIKKFPAIFEELKNVQREFTQTKMTRDHSNNIWTRLDAAFKTIKEQRFGTDNGSSSTDRMTKRYDGLLNALDSMQESIGRDKRELDEQNKRINSNATGQLEAQIRQARINMINERISSKQLKIDDMQKIKAELEEKIAQAQKKDENRAKHTDKVVEVAVPVAEMVKEETKSEKVADPIVVSTEVAAKDKVEKKPKAAKVAKVESESEEVVAVADAIVDATPEA